MLIASNLPVPFCGFGLMGSNFPAISFRWGGGVFHLHRKASQAESVPSQNYNWQNWALIEAIICIQRFANFYLGAEILQKRFLLVVRFRFGIVMFGKLFRKIVA